MGYAILMQWTLAPPSPSRLSISDMVLSRILEHYNISHPMRSTIQLRTFRAHFPSESGSTTRLLTTVTHSLPIPHTREAAMNPGAKDNTTYLFLEDRGVPLKEGKDVKGETSMDVDAKDKPEEKVNVDGEAKVEDKKDEKMDEDGFEIVDMPKDAPNGVAEASTDKDKAIAEVVDVPTRYKILALKPATSVMPTLHQLLSPFVLGLNKSARAAASTTAQTAAPTPLAGSPLMLTTLTFPPMPHPQPAIILSVHILPNASAQTIFLEAEWDGATSFSTSQAILREFLLGCVPIDVPGEPKFVSWDEKRGSGKEENEAEDLSGWVGVEKTKRITFLLAQAMRESQFI